MAALKSKSFKQSLLDKINENNPESLKEIIDKHSEQHYFHDALSEVYEEIGLKRVQVSDQLRQLIENRLINIRLLEQNEKQERNSLAESADRIDLLVFLIGELNIHRQSEDGVFVFICRTIAANIHILKKKLEFTYNVFPWEELEFCLVIFVLNIMGRDLTSISDLLLDREKILCYLNQFHSVLCIEKSKLHRYTKKIDDRVVSVSNILSVYPRFCPLYENYEILRNIYSLEQMRGYLSTLLSLDDKSPLRPIVVERTLQVVAEHLKSAPESPNISPEIEKRLLDAAPKQLRNILTRLKNKSSYTGILEEKIFVGKYNCENVIICFREFFFETLTILYKQLEKVCERYNIALNKDENTIKAFTRLSEKIENVKTELAMYRSVYKTVQPKSKYVKENKVLKQYFTAKTVATNSRELTVENMTLAMSATLNKTKIQKTIQVEDFTEDKIVVSVYLKVEENLENEEEKRCFYNKSKAQKALHLAKADILCGKIISNDEYKKTIKVFPKEVAETLQKLCLEEDLEEIKEIINGVSDAYGLLIQYVAVNGVIGLENYDNFIKKFCEVTDLENNDIVENLVEYFKETVKTYFQEKLLQLIEIKDADNLSLKPRTISIEMLLLDLLEILINTNNFTDSASYLERPAPLLVGKNLRNYLAYTNPLIDTFYFDPRNSIEIHCTFFKEKRLTFDKDVSYTQTIKFSLEHAREYYQQCLVIVENQAAMFEAARKGDLKKVKRCVHEKNANPLAFDVNGEKGSKCAVKAENVNLLAFFLKKNVNESIIDLLEVAAESGSESTLAYLVNSKQEAKDHIQGDDNKLLHLAVLNDKDRMVKNLLNLGCKTTNRVYGVNPIHLAAEKSSDTIADILLKHDGTLISLKNDFGEQPLHSAAKIGSCRCADMLLKKGAKIDAKRNAGDTALHLAVMYGHEETVKVLLEHKAQIEIRNYKIDTPLHLAALFGHRNIAELLLEKGASIEEENLSAWTPLHCAAFGGWTDLIEPLYKPGFRTKKKETPLHIAAYSGYKETVEAILDCEKNIIDSVDRNGCTALFVAALLGNVDTVKVLLNAGARTNKLAYGSWQFTAFLAAALGGHVEVVKLLFSKVSIIEANYGLYVAVERDHKSVVKHLLKTGADPNFEIHSICEELGELEQYNAKEDIADLWPVITSNCLLSAVRRGNVEAVKVLLKYGADVNAPDRFQIRRMSSGELDYTLAQCIDIGRSTLDELLKVEHPLHIATREGDIEIIRILLKHPDIEKNAMNKSGDTALFIAADNDQQSAVELLLEAGVDPNISNEEGFTPLLRAASNGFLRTTQLLLWHDATDIHAKTKSNSSALDFAALSQDTAMLKKFLAYGFSFDERYMALHKCIENEMVEAVMLLLDGVHNTENFSVDLLKTFPSLHKAVDNDDIEIIEILLNHGFDVNEQCFSGYTALHLAVSNQENVNTVKTLLRYNADVNMATASGETPLLIALQQDNVAIVGLLLKYGADATKTTNEGSIMHFAAIGSNCFEMLTLVFQNIREKYDDVLPFVNAKDSKGDTPLMWAIKNNTHLENVDLLISFGADVNIQNEIGMTALHYAVNVENVDLVKYLVENGADVKLKSNSGETAAKLAFNNIVEKRKLRADTESLWDITVYLSEI